MSAVRAIALPVPGIEQLEAEARAEGYDFLDTLVREWATGENRFDQHGEILLGCFEHDTLIAVGGLNRDPFLNDACVGRIRRVYVRLASRNQGTGRVLVTALIEHAREHFSSVRLRAENPGAARLYEHLGFVPIQDPNATHALHLAAEDYHGTKPTPPA